MPSLTASELRRGMWSYGAAFAVPGLLGLAVVPLLTRALGAAEYGRLAVCLALIAFVTPLAANPTSSAARRLYAASEAGEGELLLRALLGLSLLLGGALIVLALPVSVLAGGTWRPPLAGTAVAAGVLIVVQYLITSSYVRDQPVRTATLQIAHSVVKSAALLAGATAAATAAAALWSYVAGLVVLAAAFAIAVGRGPGALVSRERWARAARVGVPLIGLSLAWAVLAGLDRLVLAAVDGSAAAGRYAVAYIVADGAVGLLASVAYFTAYARVLNRWHAADRDGARRDLHRVIEVWLIASITIVACLALEGQALADAVGGDGFHVGASIPAAVGGGILLYRLGVFEAIGFDVHLQSRELASTAVVAGAIGIPLTIAAIVAAGATGAGWATLACYAIAFALLRRRNPARELSFPLARGGSAATRAAAVAVPASQVPAPWDVVCCAVLIPLLCVA